MALAANIAAPLFPPIWGVVLGFVALLCWAYSLAPVEKWTRDNFKSRPVVSVVYSAIALALIACSSVEASRAWHERRIRSASAPKAGNPCPNGVVEISGNDAHGVAEDAVKVVAADPCYVIKGNTSVGGKNGVDFDGSNIPKK